MFLFRNNILTAMCKIQKKKKTSHCQNKVFKWAWCLRQKKTILGKIKKKVFNNHRSEEAMTESTYKSVPFKLPLQICVLYKLPAFFIT